MSSRLATDDRNYYAVQVLPPGNWRTQHLTKELAISHAKKWVGLWSQVGLLGEAHVFYRDRKVVKIIDNKI